MFPPTRHVDRIDGTSLNRWDPDGRSLRHASISTCQGCGLPGLILYGNEDEQDNVPIQASVDRLEAVAGAESRITVRVFEGTGHGFIDATTDRIRENFLNFLSEWMTANTG